MHFKATASISLFSFHPLSKATVDEVSEKTGLNRAARKSAATTKHPRRGNPDQQDERTSLSLFTGEGVSVDPPRVHLRPPLPLQRRESPEALVENSLVESLGPRALGPAEEDVGGVVVRGVGGRAEGGRGEGGALHHAVLVMRFYVWSYIVLSIVCSLLNCYV